jgi:thymidylate synthase (FAD)
MTCEVRLVSSTQVDDEYIDYLVSQLPQDKQDEVKKLLNNKEGLMAYVARVSSSDPLNTKYAGLLKYCIQHKHWSVFEMIDVTMEITTSRAIAAQILRHKSANFQEFSQRYQEVPEDGFIIYKARRQDTKNRQNSIDDLSEEDVEFFAKAQKEVWELARKRYGEAINRGIAKECARFLLPLNTKTTLFMKGPMRTWIHYLDLRGGNGTQLEHMDIAINAKKIFSKKFPIVSEAMGWKNGT